MSDSLSHCRGAYTLEFLKNYQLFLRLPSLSLFGLRTSLHTLCTLLKSSFFNFFLLNHFFSTFAYGSGSTNGLYCPFFNWHPKRSTNNEVISLPSLWKILCVSHPTTLRGMPLHKACLTAYSSRYNTSSGKGYAPVDSRSRKNIEIENSLNLTRTNIINKIFLYSSPITGKITGSKDSPLGVRHYKLRASPRPIGEGLKPQEWVQRGERRCYILEYWRNVLIETKLPKYPIC